MGEEECDEGRLVAVLVGLKTIVNEFAAYDRLRTYQVGSPPILIQLYTLSTGSTCQYFFSQVALSPRAVAITTFALCGFSNPGEI